jgi:D-alanine-D-alanine ligase-like ATP-grasp enzyme
MKIALISNQEFSPLGWATNKERLDYVAGVLGAGGVEVEVCDVPNTNSIKELMATLRDANLVWSNAYHTRSSDSGNTVSLVRSLEEAGLPIIGPGSVSLDNMLLKERCQGVLSKQGVAIPRYVTADKKSVDSILGRMDEAGLVFPVIIKPTAVSCSKGILPDAVKSYPAEVTPHAKKLLSQYKGEVIIEEYLPGMEFTVAALGNGKTRRLYMVEIKVPGSVEGGTTILDSELKPDCFNRGTVTLEPISDPEIRRRIEGISYVVCEALGAYDFTRFDGRMDSYGQPNIFDVNGMPGLSMEESFSTYQFFELFRERLREEVFKGLIYSIVHSAAERHGVSVPNEIRDNALYLE